MTRSGLWGCSVCQIACEKDSGESCCFRLMTAVGMLRACACWRPFASGREAMTIEIFALSFPSMMCWARLSMVEPDPEMRTASVGGVVGGSG